MTPANEAQAALLAEMLADAAVETKSSRTRRLARLDVSSRAARNVRFNRLDS